MKKSRSKTARYPVHVFDQVVRSEPVSSAAGFLVPSPETLVARLRGKKTLGRLVQALRPSQALVLRLRYGIAEDGRWTGRERGLNETAKLVGVSTQRVAYIEKVALRRLRRWAEVRKLHDLLSCY